MNQQRSTKIVEIASSSSDDDTTSSSDDETTTTATTPSKPSGTSSTTTTTQKTSTTVTTTSGQIEKRNSAPNANALRASYQQETGGAPFISGRKVSFLQEQQQQPRLSLTAPSPEKVTDSDEDDDSSSSEEETETGTTTTTRDEAVDKTTTTQQRKMTLMPQPVAKESSTTRKEEQKLPSMKSSSSSKKSSKGTTTTTSDEEEDEEDEEDQSSTTTNTTTTTKTSATEASSIIKGLKETQQPLSSRVNAQVAPMSLQPSAAPPTPSPVQSSIVPRPPLQMLKKSISVTPISPALPEVRKSLMIPSDDDEKNSADGESKKHLVPHPSATPPKKSTEIISPLPGGLKHSDSALEGSVRVASTVPPPSSSTGESGAAKGKGTTTTTTTSKSTTSSSTSSSSSSSGKKVKVKKSSATKALATTTPQGDVPSSTTVPLKVPTVTTTSAPPHRKHEGVKGHESDVKQQIDTSQKAPSKPSESQGVTELGAGVNRYDDVSSSTISSDSETTDKTSTTITQLAPTTIVNRKKFIIPSRPSLKVAPLPPSFLIPRGSSQDTVFALLKKVSDAQQDNSRKEKIEAEAAGKTFDLARIPPVNHISKANFTAVLRAYGLDEITQKSVLFGCLPMTPLDVAQSLVERQLHPLVEQQLRLKFAAASEKSHSSGEMPERLAKDTLLDCGVASFTVQERFSIRLTCTVERQVVMEIQFPELDGNNVKSLSTRRFDVISPVLIEVMHLNQIAINGVILVENITEEESKQVILAIHVCTFISRLLHQATLTGGSVDYQFIIDSILSNGSPAVPIADEQRSTPTKSILMERIAHCLIHADRNIDSFLAVNNASITPFLSQTNTSLDHRRRNFIPSVSASLAAFERRTSGTRDAGDVFLHVTLKDAQVGGHCIIPPSAAKWILLSTVSKDSVVLPAVHVNSKTIARSEGHEQWKANSKDSTFCVRGSATDILYIELCYMSAENRPVCAGFATAQLGKLASGNAVLALGQGTFFSRVSESDVIQGGCLCLSAPPSSHLRMSVCHEVPHLSVLNALPIRIICNNNHVEVIGLFREALTDCSLQGSYGNVARVLRDPFTVTGLQCVEDDAVLDLLCTLWAERQKKRSKELQTNQEALRKELLVFVNRFMAVKNCVVAEDVPKVLRGEAVIAVDELRSPLKPMAH